MMMMIYSVHIWLTNFELYLIIEVFSSLYTTVPHSGCFARCMMPNPPSAIGSTSVNLLYCICLCNNVTASLNSQKDKRNKKIIAKHLNLKSLSTNNSCSCYQRGSGMFLRNHVQCAAKKSIP